MGKVLFVLGGTRSGKSAYAVNAANETSSKVAYIATCIPYDDEMHKRIRIHKQERPSEWITIEEPVELEKVLKDINNKVEVVIIDCLTLFVTNLMMKNLDESAIKEIMTKLMLALKEVDYQTIIVANEVGQGVVPESEMGRKFRDFAGRANQIAAKYADEVVVITAGISQKIK